MKKVLLFLACSALFIGCSKSDDNDEEIDPVFSQEYTPLKSFQDLESGRYSYAGNKIGDRKTGLITESTLCKKDDFIMIYKETTVALDSISYFNYRRAEDRDKDCEMIFEFPRILRNAKLKQAGIMASVITDDNKVLLTEEEKKENPDKEYKIVRKTHYSGDVEIGFQAGYLRIEDRLSDYSRTSKNEKVYLYFKKD
jgi:hypothetical protein